MAIKLLNVADSLSGTQDFVLINNPVFFVRNAADYVSLQSATPIRFFLPGWNPFRFRWREGAIALSIAFRKVRNVLNIRYWSMTPYAFGEAACKFSVRPTGTLSGFEATDADDYLRRNLAAQLAKGDATFEFMVQLRTDASLPVEDPRLVWSEAIAPFVVVATITIAMQTFDTPARETLCENLSFTPWHCVPAHRPLGGINRVRGVVYEHISKLRHEINRQPREEPADIAP